MFIIIDELELNQLKGNIYEEIDKNDYVHNKSLDEKPTLRDRKEEEINKKIDPLKF